MAVPETRKSGCLASSGLGQFPDQLVGRRIVVQQPIGLIGAESGQAIADKAQLQQYGRLVPVDVL